MTNNECLNDGAGDSPELFSANYNSGVTGGRRPDSVESFLPPLPEPVGISPDFTPLKRIHAPQDLLREDALQSYDALQDDSFSCHPGALQQGCYYIRLMLTSLHTPSSSQYEGTLRIQRTGDKLIASGDLYINDFCKTPTYYPVLSENSNRKNIIPVFPRNQYARYIRVVRIKGNPDSGKDIVLELETFRFDNKSCTWTRGETFNVEVKFSTGLDGSQYWRGDIQTLSKRVLGHMVAVRVSPYFRQALIEIDRVAASDHPSHNDGSDWQAVFEKAGWNVAIEFSDEDVEEPEDHNWSNAELHKKMLVCRQSVDLDKQWRYHLLAVRELEDKRDGVIFGVMYDSPESDINRTPREGVAVASEVIFPDKNIWGKCRGKRFGECKEAYIRTAIHEIGHAMLLYHPHNPHENYIMQRTVLVAHNAYNAVPPQQFPDNIEWSFSPQDIHLLCHLPDIAVRPGGVPFGASHRRLPVDVREVVVEADGLELNVSALHEVVPIGAPVRVNFSLVNRSDQEKLVPGSLSMKAGHVSGRIIDPSGTEHTFATIIHYDGDLMPKPLPAGGSIPYSATMLWGMEGPFFPTSGYYRIILELNWRTQGMQMRISGNTGVMVTPPKDEKHARAALKIFSTPETLLALAIGGDHLKKGYDAIHTAINNPVLKPHYNLVEAKRVSQRFFDRKPDLKKAADIVDEKTVMSPREVIRLTKILKSFTKETQKEAIEKMSKLLLTKAKEVGVEDEVGTIIKEIQAQMQ
jgi:hypothetical protein